MPCCTYSVKGAWSNDGDRLLVNCQHQRLNRIRQSVSIVVTLLVTRPIAVGIGSYRLNHRDDTRVNWPIDRRFINTDYIVILLSVLVAVYDQAEVLPRPTTSNPTRQRALTTLTTQLDIYRHVAANASAQVIRLSVNRKIQARSPERQSVRMSKNYKWSTA